MKVEVVSFWLAAAILKKYQLPVNRETVRIHKEFYDTECPARSWLIHLQQASNTLANVNRLKDYFIYKIKYYYDDITKEDMKSLDRKSTRLNSSHVSNSYAVFCLKKK